MQDQESNSLVDPMGDCSQCLLNLIIFGMATPYLHNGTLEIEDEEKQEVSSGSAFSLHPSNILNYKIEKSLIHQIIAKYIGRIYPHVPKRKYTVYIMYICI